MFCKNCGTELTDGNKFCKNCGAKIESDKNPDTNQSEEVEQQEAVNIGENAVSQKSKKDDEDKKWSEMTTDEKIEFDRLSWYTVNLGRSTIYNRNDILRDKKESKKSTLSIRIDTWLYHMFNNCRCCFRKCWCRNCIFYSCCYN